MGLRDSAATLMRGLADRLVRPSFAGTPFPSGGVERPAQLQQELGGTGTFLFGGFIRGEDPLASMDGPTAIKNLDEMRRSDAQVHASLEVIKQPIRTADYEVDPSDPDDPEAIEIAEFVRWNLFEGMTTTWDDLLRQSLLMLDFGFMLFEKVWRVQEDGPHAGKVVLHKMAPRPPKTLWQWFTDEDGALLSIKQLAVKAGTYQFLDVPASKLVRFTFQQEGDNFAGISMLRSAWPHYYIKRQLYNIDAVRASRFGVGIPRAKLSAGYSPSRDDRAALAQMLQGMSSHEHAYLIEAAQFTVDILMPTGSSEQSAVLPSIEHHNSQITRNILAQFLDMGGKASGGSHALGASAMDFFLNAIESIADQYCDVLNKQLIKDLVDMNFEARGKYPTLRPVGIQETDVKSLAAAAAALAAAGLLTANLATENTFRNLMNLPEISEEEARAGAAAKQQAPGAQPGGAAKPAPTATPATAEARAAVPATGETVPAAHTETKDTAARPATSETVPAVKAAGAGGIPQDPLRAKSGQLEERAADSPERKDWPADAGTSARPLVQDPPATPPASHDPRGMTVPARSEYYDTRPADTSGTGERPAIPATADQVPAVAAQRAPMAAETHETRTVPADPATLPSQPERTAHMARSTTIASSGDADEEGAPLSEVRLSARSRRNAARRWTAPDGRTSLWRPPTELEQHCLDLREMPHRLSTARNALGSTLLSVRKEQILRIAQAVAHAGPDAALKPPLVGKMASDILKAMRDAYEYGDQQVRQELKRQRRGQRAFMDFAWEGGPGASPDSTAGRTALALATPKTPKAQVQHLVASAQLSAQQASDKLVASARQEALRLRRAGWEDDEIEDALKIHMGELSEGDISRLAAMEVNEAFSMGRTAAAADLKDQIEKAVYSALLDDACCAPCEENDGREVDVDSAEYDELTPPFSGCDGRDQCRCVWIYELATPDEEESDDVAARERTAEIVLQEAPVAIEDEEVTRLRGQVQKLQGRMDAAAAVPPQAVHVDAPVVHVDAAPAPVVHVEAPVIQVEAPRPRRVRKTFIRDKDGLITGSIEEEMD